MGIHWAGRLVTTVPSSTQQANLLQKLVALIQVERLPVPYPRSGFVLLIPSNFDLWEFNGAPVEEFRHCKALKGNGFGRDLQLRVRPGTFHGRCQLGGYLICLLLGELRDKVICSFEHKFHCLKEP